MQLLDEIANFDLQIHTAKALLTIPAVDLTPPLGWDKILSPQPPGPRESPVSPFCARPEPSPQSRHLPLNENAEGQADRALIRRVLAGDCEAVEQFVQRMRCVPRILAARNARAGRPLGPEEVADLAQEVFATIWCKLAEYRGEAPLEAWVYPFCGLQFMNQARKHIRRQTAVNLSDLEPDCASGVRQGELDSLDTARIHAALGEIGAAERTVIEMKHFDDLTFEQIAARLSVSANSAKTRYYRGLTKLQSALGPQFFTREPS